MPIKIIEYARKHGITGGEVTQEEADKVFRFLYAYTRRVKAIYPGEDIDVTFHGAELEGEHGVEIDMKSPWVNDVMKQNVVNQVLAVRAEVIAAGEGQV